jgi:tetratricopeptide (TPR) repeat protein
MQTNKTVVDAGRSALALAQKGSLPIIELFQTGQNLVEAGERPLGIQLYRAWLANTPSPLAYAVQFNLAVMLSDNNELNEAEAAYRMALAQNPRFNEGHLNLGTLLERLRRPDEALASWRALLEYSNPKLPADQPHVVQALNNLGRLLEIQKDFPAAEDALDAQPADRSQAEERDDALGAPAPEAVQVAGLQHRSAASRSRS